MESKLEPVPVKTRGPYQLTITLNEEEIFGIRHFLGIVIDKDIDRFKKVYPHLNENDIDAAYAAQRKLFHICANAGDEIKKESFR